VKIGSKGDYGLRALIDLAEHHETGVPVQAKDIAERQSIPKDYLALIMIELRKAGLIDSVRGPGGGYRLAMLPEEITMGHALRSLESPLSLIDCTTDLGFGECSLSLRCRMRNVWIEATKAVAEILDRTTIADLCSPANTASAKDPDNTGEVAMPDGLTFHI
jgi:Rrf2 family transcriptional regulator, cysteine metabolism repressor